MTRSQSNKDIKIPVTNAVRFLRRRKIAFDAFEYHYELRGGTRVASRELGQDEHLFVKTLVFEDDRKNPLLVLMHGDMEVSAKQLARLLKVKSVRPCEPETASRHSGYMVGGTSPFGTRKRMPVYAQESIFDLERIFINGGKRGLMLLLEPSAICELDMVTKVQVGIRPG